MTLTYPPFGLDTGVFAAAIVYCNMLIVFEPFPLDEEHPIARTSKDVAVTVG